MRESGVAFPDLAAVAVTQGPGLVGSLLVGVQAAKAIALVHGKPLVPVHHVAGHVEAAFLAHGDLPLPALALVVSGGHTSLYEVPEEGLYRLLGRTRDDAAGEAFDKVAKLLGLGYPGGPVIDRLAEGANDQAVEFKVARIKDGRADFSFSGIKTAVLLHVKREGIPPVGDPGDVPARVRDLVASFQRAVVTALVRGLARAARRAPPAEPDPDRRRRRQLPAAPRGRAGGARPGPARLHPAAVPDHRQRGHDRGRRLRRLPPGSPRHPRPERRAPPPPRLSGIDGGGSIKPAPP